MTIYFLSKMWQSRSVKLGEKLALVAAQAGGQPAAYPRISSHLSRGFHIGTCSDIRRHHIPTVFVARKQLCEV
jgi:hypothetical protein